MMQFKSDWRRSLENMAVSVDAQKVPQLGFAPGQRPFNEVLCFGIRCRPFGLEFMDAHGIQIIGNTCSIGTCLLH